MHTHVPEPTLSPVSPEVMHSTQGVTGIHLAGPAWGDHWLCQCQTWWVCTGEGLEQGRLSHAEPRSPGDCEEAENERVLGVPGAQEENILCKERGGCEAPWSWSTGPRDARGHPWLAIPVAKGKEQLCWSSISPSCGVGCALTKLVKVGFGALGPRDGAHQAGLEERAPAVDEAALPSNVVLPGTKSQAQHSLSEPPTPPCTPRSPQWDTPSPEPSALWWECSDTLVSCHWPLLGMSLGPDRLKPIWWDTSHSMLALVTDLADPGHPGMDVSPLPLPSFHGHLAEKDVDLVIMWVVGIRDGVGTDKCRLCRGKKQHSMALCPDPTLRSPLEQCEVLRCPLETLPPEGRAPFLRAQAAEGVLEHGSHQRLCQGFPPREGGQTAEVWTPVLAPASPQQAGEPAPHPTNPCSYRVASGPGSAPCGCSSAQLHGPRSGRRRRCCP